MKSSRGWRTNWLVIGAAAGLLSVVSWSEAAPPPTVEQMLALRPTQPRVDYETPPRQSFDKCVVHVVREGKSTGWALKGPDGTLYRRFMDSNKDNIVDRWSYYHGGEEVYRDIDSNFNGRADQFRWLNSGGSRWAYDRDEDGRIDGYVRISAEEVAREAVLAFARRDYRLLAPLLAGPADATALARLVPRQMLVQLQAEGLSRFQQELAKAKGFSGDSRWLRFDGAVPMLIPGTAPDGRDDLLVYPQAMALVQTGQRIDLLRFGRMVQVGQAWKLLEVPAFVSGQDAEGLAQMAVGAPGGPASVAGRQAASPRQQLLDELQKLDEAAVGLDRSPQALSRYQLNRAAVLEKLAGLADNEADRRAWLRQLADALATALQAEESESVRQRLDRMQASEQRRGSPLAAYIAFRRLAADYSREVQRPGSDFAKVQAAWLDALKKFVSQFPDSDQTPEALKQLAMGLEFSGRHEQALQFYRQLVAGFADTPAARYARGAIRRLESTGKRLELAGTDLSGRRVDIAGYRGRLVFVTYWATWCQPCKAALPRLMELYRQYRSRGFEIISVALDEDRQAVEQYVRQERIPWPVIFEPGGLNSAPAQHYGIASLPANFLVGRDGNVISHTIQLFQLEGELRKLLPPRQARK